MRTNSATEGEDAFENDLDSDNQHIGSSRQRVQLSRVTAKESFESTEFQLEHGGNEKSVKLINNQRSSNRLNKRLRQESCSVDASFKKPVKPATPSVGSKTRRPWELWSVEDKNAFFEALLWKRLQSIQSYIAQRSKKKGVAINMIKNKDQVRHFYYRTWHKISKFLEISECVRKQTQELYGLINYAELRKKIGGYSKEPENEKLPKDILVEFRPHTNTAWLEVQNLAQNPRVRIKVCLQKRLKPVIEYLQRRWRSYRSKRKEHILTSLPNTTSEEITCDNQPVLRVKPSRNAKILPLSMSSMDIASSSDVCLENFMKLSHKTICKDINKSKKISRLKQKVLSDKQNDFIEVASEKVDIFSETPLDCPDTNLVNCNDTNQKSTNKIIMDDPSYINILTPPKSVPESHDSNITALLTSMLDSPNTKLPTASNEDTYSKDTNENGENNFSDISESVISEKVSSTCEEAEKDNCLVKSPESNVDACQKDNGFENNMTLGELLSLNSKKDVPSPESLLLHKEKGFPEIFLEMYEDNELNSDSIYYKTIRNGWTTEEAGFLTFGELYLLFGKPSTLVLEYEFEQQEENISQSEDDVDISMPASSEVSNILSKLYEIANNLFNEGKGKQVVGKHNAKNSPKPAKLKMCGLTERPIKDSLCTLPNANHDPSISSKDAALVNTSVSSVPDAPVVTNDKHVFVMPVGTAPRSLKPTDQHTLKEEIGKLLPGTRRGCRVRRKPLVVQRPLLPREGMRAISGPRPMTVVHFVPSVSPLTAVIPSGCTGTENKIGMPPAKKVVKILPPGSSIDMHPIQVPVLKPLHPDHGQNVILQQSSVPSSHVLVNSTSGKSIQIINDQNISCHMTTVNPAIPKCDAVLQTHENTTLIETQSVISEASVTSSALNDLNLDLLPSPQNSSKPSETFTSLSQISIPEPSNQISSSISPTTSTSFLEGLNVDVISNPKTSSSQESPTHQPFRINSPEIQWLNGESTELSLNTFLNSMESPCKVTASTSANLVADNSNLDPIVRLAPVVDSQVRCLLDECSIDFITKFEDLADVINNSSSSESKQA